MGMLQLGEAVDAGVGDAQVLKRIVQSVECVGVDILSAMQ